MFQKVSLMLLVLIMGTAPAQDRQPKYPVPDKPKSGKALLALKIMDGATKKPVEGKGWKDHPQMKLHREHSTEGGGFMPAGDGVYWADDTEPGELTITVEHKGYAKWKSQTITLEADKKKEITVELLKGVIFSGKIKLEGDLKARWVSVVFPEDIKDVNAKVESDDSFSFKDLSPGIYKFEVKRKDFKNSSFWANINADIKDLEVKIPKEQKHCSVVVNVSDEKSGDIVEKGSMIFTITTVNGPGDISVAFKDAACTQEVPPGKVKVNVSATGYKTWEKEVEIQEGQEFLNAALEKK